MKCNQCKRIVGRHRLGRDGNCKDSEFCQELKNIEVAKEKLSRLDKLVRKIKKSE